MWKRMRLWCSSVFRRRQFDDDLDRELTLHLQMRAEDLRRAGVDPAEADRRARAEFGGPEKYKDAIRDVRTGMWVEQARQDVSYGLRALIRRPVFTVTATLTLALGIGATATIFALLDAALLRELPVRAPGELAHIYTSCRAGNPYCSSSYPEYLDYRTQSRTFADMAVFQEINVSVGADAGNRVGTAVLVSTNYFTLLGVTPYAGQFFSPAWDVAADPPVVLAYETWVTQFGGEDAAIGQSLRLSGATFRIAGVAPPEFHGTRLAVRPDLWLAIDNIGLTPAGGSDPAAAGPPSGNAMLTERGRRWIGGTVGRLSPGATIDQARADMGAISDGFQQSDPGRAGRFVTVEPASRAALPPAAASDITRFIVLLMGGVAAALLIACANVAGLLLARGAARRQEIELRRALGAGRSRIVRQLMVEHMLLACAGTVCGVFVAGASMALLTTYNLPGELPIETLDLQIGVRVLLCAIVLLVVTGAVGLVPALGATRNLTATAGSRTTGESTDAARGQGVLLAAQVAVTAVLLVGAGLFIRSLQNGLNLDIGLSSQGVVTAQFVPALEGYTPARTLATVDEAIARLGGLPGVEVASVARQQPLNGGTGFLAQEIEGYSRRPDEEIRFEANFVAPRYLETLSIALRAGREFDTTDRPGAPLVGIVSESTARQYWAGRDPVGTHVRSESFPEPILIVGVARDVTVGLTEAAGPFVYLPLAQHPRFLSAPVPMMLLVRTGLDPVALTASMRGVLYAVDPTLPITEIAALDDHIAELLMPQRLGSALLSSLAGLTVVLVVVGIVGAVGYGVSRRRTEIGIRLALGAQRVEVARTMLRGTVLPLAVGGVVGLAAAMALSGLVARFLYGVEPLDATTLTVATLLIALAAGLASFVPAWRATGLNPTEVLTPE